MAPLPALLPVMKKVARALFFFRMSRRAAV